MLVYGFIDVGLALVYLISVLLLKVVSLLGMCEVFAYSDYVYVCIMWVCGRTVCVGGLLYVVSMLLVCVYDRSVDSKKLSQV